jgi:hypothetical protein
MKSSTVGAAKGSIGVIEKEVTVVSVGYSPLRSGIGGQFNGKLLKVGAGGGSNGVFSLVKCPPPIGLNRLSRTTRQSFASSLFSSMTLEVFIGAEPLKARLARNPMGMRPWIGTGGESKCEVSVSTMSADILPGKSIAVGAGGGDGRSKSLLEETQNETSLYCTCIEGVCLFVGDTTVFPLLVPFIEKLEEETADWLLDRSLTLDLLLECALEEDLLERFLKCFVGGPGSERCRLALGLEGKPGGGKLSDILPPMRLKGECFRPKVSEGCQRTEDCDTCFITPGSFSCNSR